MNHSLQTLNRNCRSQASLPAAVVLYLISIRANKAAAALPSARLVPCDSGWGWRRASASAAVCADPWRSDRRPSKARKLKRKREREKETGGRKIPVFEATGNHHRHAVSRPLGNVFPEAPFPFLCLAWKAATTTHPQHGGIVAVLKMRHILFTYYYIPGYLSSLMHLNII